MSKPANHRVSGPALGPLRAGSRANVARNRGSTGSEMRFSAGSSAATVAEVAKRYLRAHVAVNCKPKTMELYRTVIDNHIVPALGDRPIGALRRSEVLALQHELHDRPAVANSTVQVLSQLCRKARQWGLAPEGGDPCRAVRKYKLRRRDRHLTRDEYRRLGQALRDGEADGDISAPAAAALRLLVLTGCRRDEILTLRWDDVDLHARELRLRDSKSGPCMVALTPAVEAVLDGIRRIRGNPWVIVGEVSGSRLKTLKTTWRRVKLRAGLKDVRLHDLRHSYATRALALGESLTMIGKLLNHAQMQSTARYAHVMDDAEKAAAARVGDRIAAHVAGQTAAAGRGRRR
ncbi:MAG: site-specific integrase [Proteobacteria bacterium]|nr:site-specific integrase [Pseudomonadota bacterium]MYJ94691.1 site-specific integrase [Pseudomonadota bacterium]